MRVVLDVNVWVSGLLWSGVPGQVLRLIRNPNITSVVSEELLLELETTLQREKFQESLRHRNLSIDELLSIARTLSEVVAINSVEVPELRDSTDLKILATSVAASADVIVTGNQDLLVLKDFESIPILTRMSFVIAQALTCELAAL